MQDILHMQIFIGEKFYMEIEYIMNLNPVNINGRLIKINIHINVQLIKFSIF